MQQLSNYLLKLTQIARKLPANEFKECALSEAKNILPFDSCVWLMGNWVNDAPVIHSAHLHNLEDNFIGSWMRFQHQDRLAREVILLSNQTVNVDVAREYGNTDIYNMHCKSYGIEHIVATGCIAPDTLLLNSMCFYRSNIDQPFTEQERVLKQIIFQHLLEAARTNWLTHLPNMLSVQRRSNFNAIAACDNSGLLHVAMPAFVKICREEWPSWKGPFLLADVLNAARNNRGYIGESIVMHALKIDESTLLRARAKVPGDHLSSRELEIARQIADGHDGKTIALNLNISPSTVKTHTTNLYLKLKINCKAKLAAELHKMSS